MADDKRTKIKVRNGTGPGSGSDIHDMPKTPKELATQVNDAIARGERLVTFEIDGEKELSVIAENVEAIWQE